MEYKWQVPQIQQQPNLQYNLNLQIQQPVFTQNNTSNNLYNHQMEVLQMFSDASPCPKSIFRFNDLKIYQAMQELENSKFQKVEKAPQKYLSAENSVNEPNYVKNLYKESEHASNQAQNKFTPYNAPSEPIPTSESTKTVQTFPKQSKKQKKRQRNKKSKLEVFGRSNEPLQIITNHGKKLGNSSSTYANGLTIQRRSDSTTNGDFFPTYSK